MGDMQYRFFDAHLHLQDERVRGLTSQLISEAQSVGVEHLACNGCSQHDWSEVEQLAREHPEMVVPNFGLHPWWVGKQTETWLGELEGYLERNPNAGLGECGLDRCKRASHIDFDEQCEVFRQQIQLAKRLKRPASVHCVQAFGKLEEILREEAPLPDGLVLHSWGGSGAQVKSLSKLEGVYFSISGHSLSGSRKKIRPMLMQIPLERLLLETDAPDGIPDLENVRAVNDDSPDAQPLNHPANIRLILKHVASETGKDAGIIAQAAFKNACNVFRRKLA